MTNRIKDRCNANEEENGPSIDNILKRDVLLELNREDSSDNCDNNRDGKCDVNGNGCSDKEDENDYRLRVYGVADDSKESKSVEQSLVSCAARRNQYPNAGGSFRRFSKRLSKRFTKSFLRRRSSFTESLPDSPKGWIVLSCVTMSAILGYEVRLQKALTKPPIVFGQLPSGDFVEKIYKEMIENPSEECTKDKPATATRIFSRPIQPSLFLGTRGMISSSAAYLKRGPSSRSEYLQFREIFTMSHDGAQIAVDWEAKRKQHDKNRTEDNARQRGTRSLEEEILNGPIHNPVVIILHGINNDASFGYMKSLSRSFCNRGYISASMNFRGCGGLRMSTPRLYTGAYTGDLRSVVRQISSRLKMNTSLFLVGNSLGANILTKYLGEEGMFGTLPSCISGAASLGNPMLINSEIVKFPFDILMALGIKKVALENLSTLRGLNDQRSRGIVKNGFVAPTIAGVDRAWATAMIRNNPHYPFETRIGYTDAEAYWFDASSYRYVRHISIPFLNITAQDDFLVSRPSRNKLGFCLANPNVVNVETRCGGHLGWQETPPDSAFGASSWADTAASDFFDAILKVNSEYSPSISANASNIPADKPGVGCVDLSYTNSKQIGEKLKEVKAEALSFAKNNISRL